MIQCIVLEIVRPYFFPAGYVDQVRSHSPPICGSLDAPFQYVLDAKLTADLSRLEALSLEAERRRPRHDIQLVDLSQRSRQLVGNSIAERLVRRIAADFRARQHGD